MDARELFNFLNTLKHFVSPFWKGRIEQMIVKYGGTVK